MATEIINGLLGDPTVQAGGAGGAATGLVWWAISNMKKRIEKNERDITDARMELEKHRTYSEGVYAKNITIERVHERIDEMGKKQDDMFQFLINKLGNK